MSSEVLKRKLRILCLHGHHQNSTRFREKTGGFRKAFQSIAEFVFIDSPIQEGESTSEAAVEEQQTWFTTTPENKYIRNLDTKFFNGTFDQSAQFVREFVNENGPFDGLLSFSQGAAFSHALLHQKYLSSLKFVIFCCGFVARNASSKIDSQVINGIHTFHCINKNDQVIPNELSEELTTVFADPLPLIHHYDCGHCLPPLKLCKLDFSEFFKRMAEL
ncbi:Esterase OVCA2-like isoform X1 [Aphelenchoides besseyi]|nr:Esterase OVCA2-like isoform X1 [Aphelenchoides besseyi]